MPSRSGPKRAFSLSILLSITFIAPNFPAHGEGGDDHGSEPETQARPRLKTYGDDLDHSQDVWEITDQTTCTGGKVPVDSDNHIHENATLELRGCTLVRESAPYEDQQIASQDEGLTI